MVEAVYQSLDALKPVRILLDEAGAASRDHSRRMLASGMPEVAAAAAGVGAGAATGALLVTSGAASGTAGAAALTSGLASAGGLVGGGMVMGIAVAAAPAVLLGIGGLAAVTVFNRRRLKREQKALLQEAIRKHQAVQDELRGASARNLERAEYLRKLVILLQATISNLQGDLGDVPL